MGLDFIPETIKQGMHISVKVIGNQGASFNLQRLRQVKSS